MAISEPSALEQIFEQQCSRITQLTKRQYEMVTSRGHFILVGPGGPVGHWTTLHETKAALDLCVLIINDAFLELVLFGGTPCDLKKKLARVEQDLCKTKEQLSTASAELKILRRAEQLFITAAGLPGKKK